MARRNPIRRFEPVVANDAFEASPAEDVRGDEWPIRVEAASSNAAWPMAAIGAEVDYYPDNSGTECRVANFCRSIRRSLYPPGLSRGLGSVSV